MRGKSQRSVRESGDSVERLEGCSGAKDARSGKERHAVGRALACTSAAGGQARGDRLASRQACAQSEQEKRRKRTTKLGQGAAALGQPVGPTAVEEKLGESSGLDWSRIRSSSFELNIELSIYARKRIK
ncbi:hypothetical protein CRG98_013468 [Punica granatum]|uniref:Uncharacterized protein n=1 Tax=Punica granatum TaxID=22663 RepID=A0A2I0KC89_PUNGR|nr:hypothetical protein CRG98_013468 [Punica granatum]